MLFLTLDAQQRQALTEEATEGTLSACEKHGDSNSCAAMSLMTDDKPQYAARVIRIRCGNGDPSECEKLLAAENTPEHQRLACRAGSVEGCLRLKCERPSREKFAQLVSLCSAANPLACVCAHDVEVPARKTAVLALLNRYTDQRLAPVAPNLHEVRVRLNELRKPFAPMYDSCAEAERDINEKGKLAGIAVKCDAEAFGKLLKANREKYEREQKAAEEKHLREQTGAWCACKG